MDRAKALVTITVFDNEQCKAPSTEWITLWQKKSDYNLVTIDRHNHHSDTPTI